MGAAKLPKKAIVRTILHHLGCVEGIYLFGSAVTKNDYGAQSDIDIAVLIDVKPEPESVFQLKSALSEHLRRDIDLVDLRRADVVTRAQVVSSGDLLYARDALFVGNFETTTLSEYAQLNEERRGIVEDIIERGTIFG